MISAMHPAPLPLELPFEFAPRLPGSKSIANRALVLAALARGKTEFAGLSPSDDVAAMKAGLRSLGAKVAEAGGGGGGSSDGYGEERAIVHGIAADRAGARAATLDCGLGGTTARFLLALAAVVPGRWTITGGARLRERPMAELLTALAQLGARIEGDVRVLPATLVGGTLVGGSVRLDASRSSQFLSALLLVGAATRDGIEVVLEGPLASEPYVEMTIAVLARFGVKVERGGHSERGAAAIRSFRVPPQPIVAPPFFPVDADASAAGAWWLLAMLTGAAITMPMGGAIPQPDSGLLDLVTGMPESGPCTVDVAALPDQLMNLAVVAAARQGTTRFTGAANLRLKESDRLAVLAAQLGRAGIVVAVEPDGIVVTGRARLRAATLDACGDHRMAIAFALLATLHPGIEVVGRECVTKSDPGFFAELARLREPAAARCIALVGMRGAGKSTLAPLLAARLGLAAHDTDAEFERRHGEIAKFVERRGWPAFRTEEARIVDALLGPGRVVALGGGAIETEAVRQALLSRAIVVWVQEALATLAARLAAAGRPGVTGSDPIAELPELLARREPHWREAARVALAPGRTVPERVEEAVAALRRFVRWPQE
ncbi:MAG: hypothetical protein FJ293_11700 [Planctomycetes bacterium]|nr:hypothetical protein [Planctomycetota bacterium]